MNKITKSAHAAIFDSAQDLVNNVVMTHYPAMTISEREELLMYAYGAYARALHLPAEEFAALAEPFQAKAVEVGKALAAGALVEDALRGDTPYCVQAE